MLWLVITLDLKNKMNGFIINQQQICLTVFRVAFTHETVLMVQIAKHFIPLFQQRFSESNQIVLWVFFLPSLSHQTFVTVTVMCLLLYSVSCWPSESLVLLPAFRLEIFQAGIGFVFALCCGDCIALKRSINLTLTFTVDIGL